MAGSYPYACSVLRIVVSVVLLVVGSLAMVSGELDDSPGLGGIGLLVIAGVMVMWFRRWRGHALRK
jgi:hypothetical protein